MKKELEALLDIEFLCNFMVYETPRMIHMCATTKHKERVEAATKALEDVEPREIGDFLYEAGKDTILHAYALAVLGVALIPVKTALADEILKELQELPSLWDIGGRMAEWCIKRRQTDTQERQHVILSED